MPDYRRARHPGGIYFFTLTLLQRRDNDLLTRHIEELREAVRAVHRAHPFDIHGWVVLPDHFHCVVQLPEGDADFTLRLRLIKAGFSKSLPRTEWLSAARRRRAGSGASGLVERVADWPYSTFHRLVAQGVHPPDWGGSVGAEALDYPD